MTTPAADSPLGTDLATRYGAPRPLRKRALVACTVVAAVAGLCWLVWVMLVHGRPAAQSSLISFDPVGQHAVEARFIVVRRSSEVEASCLVRALAADHTVVGELDVTVGADQPVRTTLERTVRTEREATSVEMVGCTADGQNRRR